jgi:hypothetical protein
VDEIAQQRMMKYGEFFAALTDKKITICLSVTVGFQPDASDEERLISLRVVQAGLISTCSR